MAEVKLSERRLTKALEAALRDKIIDDDETRAGFWIPYEHLARLEDALAASKTPTISPSKDTP